MNKIEELAADIRGHQHQTIFLARKILGLVGEAANSIKCPNCNAKLLEYCPSIKNGYERCWLCPECQRTFDLNLKQRGKTQE